MKISVWVLPVLLLAPLVTAPAFGEENGCQGGDRVTPVTAFGRPQTTFSRESAATEEELQRLFVTYEDDLRAVLELAGWGGDPDELFAAVRAGKAEEASLSPGTEFEWMAFRKRGKPACVKNIMWKGAEPAPVWSVEVESNGYHYTMTVPKSCLNLSMTRGSGRMVPAPPPTCELAASFDAESDTITVRGSTDGAALVVTSVGEPSGPGDLARLESAGENVWTYKPTDDGRYSFTANARQESGSQNTDCSAGVDVERRKPKFDCVATVDPDTGLINVDCTKSVGDVEITGIALPDGGAGDLSALMAAGPSKWTFDPADTLPRKPGDYDYTFSGVARLNGFEDSGSVSATVNVPPRGGSWIFRFFGAAADASGDSIMTGPVRQDPDDLLSPFVSTKRMIGDGTGFGLGLERLINDRYGVELDALFIDLDGNRIFDMGDEWTMSNPGVGFDAISVGLNVHLTPEKLYDVFIGPFVSNVSYSDGGFNVTEPDFGSEVGIGAKIGADWYFGGQSKWALATAIRYLPIKAGDDDNEFDVDPLIGTVGLGVRF
ncbi:MAG: porin family protein [bacterium]|nr:porin family protein [bacterium]